MNISKRTLAAIVAAAATSHSTLAAPPNPKPYQFQQPNGALTPPLYLRGNVDFHWEEDADGYAVTNDEKGFKVYAASRNEKTGELESSGLRVGSVDPRRRGELRQNLGRRMTDGGGADDGEQLQRSLGRVEVPIRGRRLPVVNGALKQLVILFRYSDHVDRDLPSVEELRYLFNSKEKNEIVPYGSVKEVYRVSSLDQLDIETTITPWVTLSKPEAYYGAGDSAKYTNEIFEGVTEALQKAEDEGHIESFSDYDMDNNGKLDMFSMMHSGYDATSPKEDCYGTRQKDRIWSQTKGFGPGWTSKDGIRVNQYALSSVVTGLCGKDVNHIGTVAHEMGHYLGIPDLYDRNGGGKGIGAIGIMGSGHGFDASGNKPSIMTAWTRDQLGWSDTVELDKSGKYTLEGSGVSKKIYKISRGYPDGEYLLIENKQPKLFDVDLPHGGLAIWHIDERASPNRNLLNQDEGYPGQSGWPSNGKHYWVALLQADGRYDLEKGNNKGDDGDLFHGEGVNRLGPSKDVMTGPFPNTDSYQHGEVTQTGIEIHSIGPSGDTIEFELTFPEDRDESIAFAQEFMLEDQFVSYNSGVDHFDALIQDFNGMLYEFEEGNN